MASLPHTPSSRVPFSRMLEHTRDQVVAHTRGRVISKRSHKKSLSEPQQIIRARIPIRLVPRTVSKPMKQKYEDAIADLKEYVYGLKSEVKHLKSRITDLELQLDTANEARTDSKFELKIALDKILDMEDERKDEHMYKRIRHEYDRALPVGQLLLPSDADEEEADFPITRDRKRQSLMSSYVTLG